MKSISKRIVADPVSVLYIIGKNFFRQWLLFTLGLCIGNIVGAIRGNQNVGEAILVSLVIYFVIPIIVLSMLVAIYGKENFLHEIEDVVHVVRPNFSFQKKKD